MLLLVCRCVWSRVLLIPLQYWRVLLSCRVPFFVGCVVCGWCVSVCGVRSVGYPLCATPSSWWWVGLSWMVGWHGEVGGIVREGRWCQWLPLLSLLSSLSDISVPFCLCGGPVEWRGGCVVLCLWFGSSPLRCSVRLAVSCFPLCCALWGRGGVVVLLCCELCSAVLFLSSCFCVRCHSIVGLCGVFSVRVVSLWNSGDGCVWVERADGVWRVVFSVGSSCVVVCVVVVVHVVLCCWLLNGGGVLGCGVLS